MHRVLQIACFLSTAAFAAAQTNIPPITDKIAGAAKRGDIAATLALTEQDGGPRGQGGTTALLNSARAGQLGVLKAALDAGADPNRPGRQGGLPLLQAISARQKAAAKLLIERGANPNKEGLCGRPRCEKHPALFGAVDVGDAETLQALLAAGADVSWQDHQCTQWANMNGDVEIFDLLKRAGGHEWNEHPAVRLKISGAAAAAERERSRTAAPLAPAALGLTELVASEAAPAARNPSAVKCRMAVLADESNRAAADLLLAKLAGVTTLEIVERADMEKILGEQKLARDFSGDAAAAVKIGALLRADALLFVRTQQVGETRLVETRFVRVNPGLVLDTAYRPAPLTAPEAWAGQIAARIAPLAGRTIEREGVAFSILNLRSTMGGVESRLLEQKVAALLTDRLVHQPPFHVLERTALDQLARETDPARPQSFWTGSYLLDGSIDAAADASEEVTITLRLQPAGGGAARTLVHKGRAAQMPALLDEVVADIARTLGKSDASPARDLAVEAAEYAREAAWAKACRMPLAASRAAETAWSLGDHSAETARLRVEQASAAIDDQVKRVGDAAHRAVSPDDSIWVMRDLFNNPLRPADALSEEALVNLGAQTAGAWRDVLAALPDGLGRDAWLKTGLDVCNNALLAIVLVDTAAAKIRVAASLRALKAELRGAVEAGISASKDTPRLAEFCLFKARYAPAFSTHPPISRRASLR